MLRNQSRSGFLREQRRRATQRGKEHNPSLPAGNFVMICGAIHRCKCLSRLRLIIRGTFHDIVHPWSVQVAPVATPLASNRWRKVVWVTGDGREKCVLVEFRGLT